MNGLRFKVGELVLIGDADPSYRPVAPGSIGVVESIGVVDTSGRFWDYAVDCPDDSEWVLGFRDNQLRKIDPPTKPTSLTRLNECEEPA